MSAGISGNRRWGNDLASLEKVGTSEVGAIEVSGREEGS